MKGLGEENLIRASLGLKVEKGRRSRRRYRVHSFHTHHGHRSLMFHPTTEGALEASPSPSGNPSTSVRIEPETTDDAKALSRRPQPPLPPRKGGHHCP